MKGPFWTIAKVTIWEASRRRLLLALLVLTLIIIAFTGWGYSRLWTVHESGVPIGAVQVKAITSQVLILIAFVFAGVLALSAVMIASSSISQDIESGLALAVLARPVSRAEWLLGKWSGLAVLIVAYAAGSGWLELGVARLTTGYLPPHPWQLVGALAGEGLVLLTLALCLSTRLAGMTAGIISLVGYFMAWVGGIVSGIGIALNNAALADVGGLSRLLLPTDGLWRGAVWAMEPAAVLAVAQRAGPLGAANPFMVASPAQVSFLVWSALWVGAVLVISWASLRAREI